MSADPERAALDRRILDWMEEPWGAPDEERFVRSGGTMRA